MRINKNTDSPLNESQYSDFQPGPSILDPGHNLAYKPVCFYHPDQNITNFCRSVNCLLPLCPECVKLHATSHRSQGTHGEFDTIENTVKELYQDLSKHELNFREDEMNFKDFLKLTSEYHNLMMQKVLNAKMKLLENIESYFTQLVGDLEKRVSLQVQRAQTEIYANLDKMKARQDQIKEFTINLRNQRVLKTSIHLLSTPFSNDQLSAHREFQSLHNLLHSQKLDVLADENVLHSINCNMVKYISIHNFDLYKPDEARIPVMTQKVITTSMKPQIIRSQSPIMITNIKASQNPMSQQTPIYQQQNPAIPFQNPPLNQSKANIVTTKYQPSNQIMVSKQQESHTFHIAPQNKPPENNLKASASSKVHRVHPSIPGDPVIIDLNKEPIGKETGGFMQVRSNPKFLLTQSPPVRVRSVSPTQMVRVIYHGVNGSNGKMNTVYLENEVNSGGVMESGGLRTTSKKKNK